MSAARRARDSTGPDAGGPKPEYAEPPVLAPIESGNITDHLLDSERDVGGSPAVALPEGAGWRDLTYRQFADEVRAVAKGVIANIVGAGDPQSCATGALA